MVRRILTPSPDIRPDRNLGGGTRVFQFCSKQETRRGSRLSLVDPGGPQRKGLVQ